MGPSQQGLRGCDGRPASRWVCACVPALLGLLLGAGRQLPRTTVAEVSVGLCAHACAHIHGPCTLVSHAAVPGVRSQFPTHFHLCSEAPSPRPALGSCFSAQLEDTLRDKGGWDRGGEAGGPPPGPRAWGPWGSLQFWVWARRDGGWWCWREGARPSLPLPALFVSSPHSPASSRSGWLMRRSRYVLCTRWAEGTRPGPRGPPGRLPEEARPPTKQWEVSSPRGDGPKAWEAGQRVPGTVVAPTAGRLLPLWG